LNQTRTKTGAHQPPTIEVQVMEMQMNHDLPFIWRKNYRNEMASPERLLEIGARKGSTISESCGRRCDETEEIADHYVEP